MASAARPAAHITVVLVVVAAHCFASGVQLTGVFTNLDGVDGDGRERRHGTLLVFSVWISLLLAPTSKVQSQDKPRQNKMAIQHCLDEYLVGSGLTAGGLDRTEPGTSKVNQDNTALCKCKHRTLELSYL